MWNADIMQGTRQHNYKQSMHFNVAYNNSIIYAPNALLQIWNNNPILQSIIRNMLQYNVKIQCNIINTDIHWITIIISKDLKISDPRKL